MDTSVCIIAGQGKKETDIARREESFQLKKTRVLTTIPYMSIQGHFHALLGLAGLALIIYSVLTAAGRIPVPSLIPPKTEKDRQRQMRFYAVSYGGMGLMALTEMLDFYTDWQWVITLGACVRIVVTVYILVRLVFKPYIPGYYPGDTADRAEAKARQAQMHADVK